MDGVVLGLQLLEITRTVVGHQANIALLEVRQSVFRRPQALLVIRQLRLEELLRGSPAFQLPAERLFHEGIDQDLHHPQGARPVAILVANAVDLPGRVAILLAIAGAAHREHDAVDHVPEDLLLHFVVHHARGQHPTLGGDLLHFRSGQQ